MIHPDHLREITRDQEWFDRLPAVAKLPSALSSSSIDGSGSTVAVVQNDSD